MSNANFQSYVTSHAFVLALSKPQIEALYWVAHQQSKWRAHAIPYMTSIQSLSRKGLIARDAARMSDPWVTTEEGKLALELCKRAGLLDQFYRQRKAA